MSVLDLVTENQKVIDKKRSEIQVIERSITNSKNRLSKKIIKKIKENDSIIDTKLLVEHFGYKKTISMLMEIFEERQLQPSEINDDLLTLLERVEDKKSDKMGKLIYPAFSSFEDKDKFKIAMFCSGICSLHNKYDFMQDFLEELGFNFGHEETSRFSSSGYNYETQFSVVKLTFHKNDEISKLDLMAEQMDTILGLGYLPPILDIFERTLSKYCHYSINLVRGDNNQVTNIEISEGRYSKNTVFEGSVLKQLKAAFKHCSERIYYSSDDDDD